MKREMRELILIVFLLLPGSLIAQTSYYVSSSEGSDSNTGTSSGQPWRSLEKVNSLKPAAGDKILFKRGDQWVGTLTPSASGSAGNPITYGAYGTGNKPKIYGSEVITGWTVHSGNIYKATLSNDINQLFLDGERIQLARIPKTGYYDVTSVNSTTQFVSTQVSGAINHTGAKAVIRTNKWGMATKSVTGSSSQTITVESAPLYTISTGDGFFLNNKLDYLTAAGEYYYNASTNTVYLWTPSGDSPANYEVRGSSVSNLISMNNKDYITIENLELSQCSDAAISTDYCDYLTINNVDIINPDSKGIYINHDTYGNYTNITIDGANHIAFHAQMTSYSNISDNTITNTALFDNLGLTGMGSEQDGKAISNPAGTNNTFRYNRIENVGYTALGWTTQNAVVDKNFIKNACLVKDDGGGIYSFSSSAAVDKSGGSKVTNNIVLYTRGTTAGTNSKFSSGFGIYMDNNIKNVLVQGNTIAYSGFGGIHLHENDNITVNNNTIFDGMYGVYSDEENGNCTITNNIIYVFEKNYENYSDTRVVGQRNGASHVYDNNKYYSKYKEGTFRDQESFTAFAAWKSATGQDANSTLDGSPLADGEKEELFYNDTKQTKTISLGSSVYRNLDGKEVSGSISLEPFTSQILIKTSKETTEKVNQAPEIQDQSFEISSPKEVNELIGQVTANDPDAGQELTYSIVEGNEENLFAIEALTGELTANIAIPATNDQTTILTVQVTDSDSSPLSANAQITIRIKAIETAPAPDTTNPVIVSFSVPSTSTTLSIPVTEFTASDNSSIAGYQLTESASAPATGDTNWTSSAPDSYTFSGEGTHTLYAWAKDAAGNISAATSRSVSITLPDLSPTFSEYLFEEPSGETVIDTQGSNDGTLLNEEIRVEGVIGDGLQLNGKGYISLGNAFGANVQDQLTLSAWIQPQSTSSIYQGIIMHGGPNVDSYALYIHPEYQSISFKTSGTTSAWTTIGNIADLWDGNWHHVAVTYDGNQKTIYLDNEVLITVNASGSIDSGEGYNLLIGAGRDEENPTLLYEGLIDEVRIYNSALTSSEISELYNRVKIEPNQSPEILAQSFEITEPKSIDDLIGKITATDPDANQTLNYTITEGNTSGLFKIDPATGEVFANTNLAASSDQTITLLVKVTDNHQEPLSASANITITIQAVETNKQPVIQDLSLELPGNFEVNDLVGKIIASDPDAGQLLTYTITGGNEAGLFKINPETGEIRAAADFITTTDKTVVLAIEVKDNGNEPLSAFATATINITAIQLNQNPVIADQSFDIDGDLPSNTLIGKIVASDPDAGQNLSYLIVQGNEAGTFKLNAQTGEIITNQVISSNIGENLNLVVQVTDDHQIPLSAQANISIHITPAFVNQSPVIYDQSFEIRKNAKLGDMIGQVIATDPNTEQRLTFSILSGNEEGAFSIDPETGGLYATDAIQISTSESIVLEVEVTDNAVESLSASAYITVNIVINGKIVDGEVKNNNPNRIILTYSESLKSGSLKSSQIYSDFTLSGGKAVKQVTINGNEIYLDLDSKYEYDDEIIVSYSRGTTPIYDEFGNEMEPFENYQIANNIMMGNGINTGIDPTANALDVIVFPNPSAGQVNIRANNLSSDDCELFLFSMTGNLVSKKLVSASFGNLEERLNLSHLKKGTYVIKLISKRQIFQDKIVIM